MNGGNYKIPGVELSDKIARFIYDNRKALLRFLLIAFLLHSLPIVLNIKLPEKKEVKRPPTTVKFIQRPPRLTKSIEFRKMPTIVERVLQRFTAPQKPRFAARSMTTAVTHSGTSLASLARPGEYVERTYSPPAMLTGPSLNYDITNMRYASKSVKSLQEELISYTNFMDRFEGWLERGRSKEDWRGFLNVYQVEYRSSKSAPNGEPMWNYRPAALQNLQRYAMEVLPNLQLNLMGSIRLDSKNIMDVPILIMMGYDGEVIYTKNEVENLARYLRSGGFLFIDDGLASAYGPFTRSVKQLIQDALGYDAVWERIPNNHPIYHIWKDFDGAPAGDDLARVDSRRPAREVYNYLEGIWLDGRLAVVLSNKGYTQAWGDWPYATPPLDNARQLQLGLNILIFAMNQPGGIVAKNKEKVVMQQ
jgi:hypothetical protein